MTAKPEIWTEAALAEYEAHRAEVLAEGQAQHQTLALGATAVGILYAGAFNIADSRDLATAAFLGRNPSPERSHPGFSGLAARRV